MLKVFYHSCIIFGLFYQENNQNIYGGYGWIEPPIRHVQSKRSDPQPLSPLLAKVWNSYLFLSESVLAAGWIAWLMFLFWL